MQIKNIEKKIKATKEKTEVLGGRISPTKMVAFNMIADALDVSTAELFKATIDECIESFFKSMIKIDVEKARKIVDERLDKTMKKVSKNTFQFKDYSILTPAEQKVNSTKYIKSFPGEIPLFWFFDDIKLDFNRDSEKSEKARWNAHKNFLDEIEEKENSEFYESHKKRQDHNTEAEARLKEEELNNKIIQEYYECINASKEATEELKARFDALDPDFVKQQELLQYPFVKDRNGKQKYSDEEILKAVNDVVGSTITLGAKNDSNNLTFDNIQDIHDYMQKIIQKHTEEEQDLMQKLEVMGVQDGEYGKDDLVNINEDPFGITDGFMSKQKLSDDMIVNYWKHYMGDIEYFKNKDFTVENIRAYTILKNDGILENIS